MAGRGPLLSGGLRPATPTNAMRTELYEQYKQEHPEELKEVNGAFGYSRAVEEDRKAIREDKVLRIQRWKAILAAENREGTENGQRETGSGG